MALNRRIYSLRNRPGFKWQYIVQAQLLKKEGDAAHADAAAESAYATAGHVYNYFFDTFQRDSYNGGGRKIDVYVHRGRKSKEAQFHHTPEQDLISMGDGAAKPSTARSRPRTCSPTRWATPTCSTSRR